jgi:hypothetical protein
LESACRIGRDERDESLDLEERNAEDTRPHVCLDQRSVRQTPIRANDELA